jgi:hypothetical protein
MAGVHFICGTTEIESEVYVFNDTEQSMIDYSLKHYKTTRKNCTYNEWVDYWMKWRFNIKTRLNYTIYHFKYGVRCRYPLCCIIHFCLNELFISKFQDERKVRNRGVGMTKYRTFYKRCFLCDLKQRYKNKL